MSAVEAVSSLFGSVSRAEPAAAGGGDGGGIDICYVCGDVKESAEIVETESGHGLCQGCTELVAEITAVSASRNRRVILSLRSELARAEDGMAAWQRRAEVAETILWGQPLDRRFKEAREERDRQAEAARLMRLAEAHRGG